MYQYRKLTPDEQDAVVRERQARGFPAHSPPHFDAGGDQPIYLLTAACYEHACRMAGADRRRQVRDALCDHFSAAGLDIRAWVVLPNHYHVLVRIPHVPSLGALLRRVHGPTARQWNLEDGAAGRRVWYHFRTAPFARRPITTPR